MPTMEQIISRLSQDSDKIENSEQNTIMENIVVAPHMKETRTAKNVETLKLLMSNYGKTDEEELLEEIMKGQVQEDIVTFRVLYTGPVIKTIHAQAITELKIENQLKGYNYIDRFLDDCPSPTDCLSVEETAELHLEWCLEQGVDIGDFLMKLYAVLSKQHAKVNCFMMQGQSNAGKTYWTSPLLPFPDRVGQTVQSQDFAFMRCINKDVIQIPELSLSKPEQVEEMKVFEGLPTTVNIKNREPKILLRTPVLLTCNNVPWRFFNEEQDAFKNRMYAFGNLHKSTILEGKKAANPKYFRRISKFIREETETQPEYPCTPDDTQMWQLYTETLGSYVQTLKLMSQIDLQHILSSEHMQDSYLLLDFKDEACFPVSPTDNMLSWRSAERLGCPDACILREVYTWIYWLNISGTNDYYFQPRANNTVQMYSGWANAPYDPESDLDYSDYLQFRSGYSHIKRLLIKIKTWPEVLDDKSQLPERVKFILKSTLQNMASYLARF